MTDTPNGNGKRICGAKTRSGAPCQSYPMANGRCRMHGGTARKGVDSPRFVHGRHSKYMPFKFVRAYEEALANSSLLDLRHDIALLDALIADNLGKLDTTESAAAWASVRKLVDKAMVAYQNENLGSLWQAFEDLQRLADGRILHYETQGELRSQLEQRRRLVETDHKITHASDTSITAEQFLAFITLIVNLFNRVVDDDTKRRAFAAGLDAVVIGTERLAETLTTDT